jgi:uncharacterized protein
MTKPKSVLKVFTETGPLIVLAVTIAIMVGIVGPASAQFFNFGGPQQRPAQRGGGFGGFGGNNWFGNDFFQPFQPSQAPRRVYQDFSKAPAPEKRADAGAVERNVLVLGDGMADWLAYGLEDAYSEQPDMGVIRKAKNTSGLIKYQPKGDPVDWAAAAKGILTTEKPDVIVVMLGINDRIALREPAVEKTDKPGDKKTDKKDARAKPDGKPDAKPDAKPSDAKPDAKSDGKPDAKPEAKSADGKAPAKSDESAAKPADKAVDTDLPQDDADNADPAPLTTPGKTARSPNGLYEFRDDRWVELYTKKIEEMIAVVKSKGVPVIWVGLPAVRGPRGTSDMLFLDSLYRDVSGKAGITYVDIWDGFVDEAGRFLQKGPDFEGQPRKLRADDGVYFTKPGARKLAHYVEREITRVLAGRSAPIALPTEPATPDANAVPGQPAPRPLAGPILPLIASSVGTDQLLGGPGSRPAAVDALAARTLVKGEALAPPAGRADDFVWPRREVGREQAKGDSPVAAATPADNAAAASPAAPSGVAAPPKPKRIIPQQPAQARPPSQPAVPDLFGGFGGGFGQPSAPRQAAPPARGPIAPGVPRPPASVGRSAAAQSDWFR